jgi:enoyl-CoA hydratase/carnithine racemase
MEQEHARRPPEGDWLGTPYLRFERRGPLAVVTVDRPRRRNAMTAAMYFGVRYAVDLVERSPELAALVLTGTDDVFVSGGDLAADPEDSWIDLAGLLHMDTAPFEAIRTSSKPVVAAVNGLCYGGGLMIAIVCDVAIAAQNATFRAPEVFRGIADTGFASLLPAQIGVARARDLLLAGRTIDAATAVEWGLVARACPTGAALDVALGVAADLARAAPGARAVVKREINAQYARFDRMSMAESLRGPEAHEGFLAFKERRMPSWVPDELAVDGRL